MTTFKKQYINEVNKIYTNVTSMTTKGCVPYSTSMGSFYLFLGTGEYRSLLCRLFFIVNNFLNSFFWFSSQSW